MDITNGRPNRGLGYSNLPTFLNVIQTLVKLWHMAAENMLLLPAKGL